MKTIKNADKPTSGQIRRRNRMWAEALLKNEKKARRTMRRDGGRCCLAVAEDVAKECGLAVDYGKDVPTQPVVDFFGWDSTNPKLNLPGGKRKDAALLNDGILTRDQSRPWLPWDGIPHTLIAECVLNTFVHPKRQKWSFELEAIKPSESAPT